MSAHLPVVAALLSLADRIERRAREMKVTTIDQGDDIADVLAELLKGITSDIRRAAQTTAEASAE